MPRVTAHAPGRPCWVDVTVENSDQRRALMRFYESLFDWTFDEGGAEMGFYTIASHDSQAVMGLGEQPGADGRATTYFATDDAAASAARAAELGATVVMGPMDVAEVGTMALVADPTGAVHGLWRPETFAGFGELYEVGTPGWFDHSSSDPAAAAAYYSALTGFAATEPSPGMTVLADGDQWFASVSANPIPSRPAQWNALYITDSLERVRETVTRAGGSVLVEEMPVPGSAITVFTEPVMGTAVTVMRAGEHE